MVLAHLGNVLSLEGITLYVGAETALTPFTGFRYKENPKVVSFSCASQPNVEPWEFFREVFPFRAEVSRGHNPFCMAETPL